MAISNGYATLAQFKVRAGIAAGGAHDDEAERAIEASSRHIDRWCGRRFYADTAATARYYTALPEEVLLLPVDDISSVTSLVVKTDDDYDGTYEHTWTRNLRSGSYGFMVEPTNFSAQGRPITRLRATLESWPTVRQGVEVTALWGWPAIPAEVIEACLIHAARLYKRKDVPYGVMGTAEVGFVSQGQFITVPKLDPDVAVLLNPYRRFDLWGD